MNTLLMNSLHQDAAPWTWPLDDRAAATLRAEPTPRWLHVEEGCIWVTAQDGGPYSEDLWLGAGESLALPAGSAWVVEAWPQARLSLLLAQPAIRPEVSSPRSWWQSSWLWPWVLPEGRAGRRALA